VLFLVPKATPANFFTPAIQDTTDKLASLRKFKCYSPPIIDIASQCE
jgi:hypothetical protein